MCNTTTQTDNTSFQERLKHVAQQCAEGADIQTVWHDFLYSILEEWNADIQMNLCDAVAIMLSATGLNESIICRGFMDYVRHMLLGVKRNEKGIAFWFKLPAEIQMFPQKMQHKKRVFMMTVAVFETINYWCWHDSVSISFNGESLIDVLENGSIHVDWASYQQP